MKEITLFIKESYTELLTKVSWPSYSSLQNSTIVVLVASLIFAVMIGGVDFVFKNVLSWLYKSY